MVLIPQPMFLQIPTLASRQALRLLRKLRFSSRSSKRMRVSPSTLPTSRRMMQLRRTAMNLFLQLRPRLQLLQLPHLRPLQSLLLRSRKPLVFLLCCTVLPRILTTRKHLRIPGRQASRMSRSLQYLLHHTGNRMLPRPLLLLPLIRPLPALNRTALNSTALKTTAPSMTVLIMPAAMMTRRISLSTPTLTK